MCKINDRRAGSLSSLGAWCPSVSWNWVCSDRSSSLRNSKIKIIWRKWWEPQQPSKIASSSVTYHRTSKPSSMIASSRMREIKWQLSPLCSRINFPRIRRTSGPMHYQSFYRNRMVTFKGRRCLPNYSLRLSWWTSRHSNFASTEYHNHISFSFSPLRGWWATWMIRAS